MDKTKNYTTSGGCVELMAPVDGETCEGRAVYADAKRAAQAMADETQVAVEVYAAGGYVMSVAMPAAMDTDLDGQAYRIREDGGAK